MWNCGVIHPYGLDPLAGDAETIKGLVRSLEILTYMKSELVRLDINCGESEMHLLYHTYILTQMDFCISPIVVLHDSYCVARSLK